MRLESFLLSLGTLVIVSCNYDNKLEEELIFKTPFVINSQISDTTDAVKFHREYVSEVFPRYIGKYKFTDSLDIFGKGQDSTMNSDYCMEFGCRSKLDSIDVNGFEIVADYKSTVFLKKRWKTKVYKYFPVYIVNSTKSDKLFLGKDSYVYGIQEAQTMKDLERWRPIEGRGFDFCGNGDWGVIVHPNEFLVVLMRKYEGNFETNLRVRFRNRNSIYVSNSFPATINKDQLTINENSHIGRLLKRTEGHASNSLFYGAKSWN